MKKHIKRLKPKSNRSSALLFAAIFAALGVYIIAATRAAVPGATLKLTPASATVNAGDNFVVTIYEDSGLAAGDINTRCADPLTNPDNCINTLQAVLNYNTAQLKVISVDANFSAGTSDFDTPVENTFGSGKITLALGNKKIFDGQKKVAVVTFQALTTGSANVSFDMTPNTGSSVLKPEGGTSITNVLTSATGGTYTIGDTSAPAAPTSLAVTGTTVNSVSLSWTAPVDNVGVTGYTVTSSSGKTVDTKSTALTFTETGLNPATAYTYTVKAYDAQANPSQASNQVTGTTLADTVDPSVPTGLTTSAITGTSLNLSWTASTDNVGVKGYNVYRDNVKLSKTITTNSTSDSGLTSGQVYSYKVEAYDAAGNVSAQSTALSVTTTVDTTPPPTPGALSLVSKTHTSVNLKWNASVDNIGTTGYIIFRNGAQLIDTKSTALTYTDTLLTPGNTYTYNVTAYDANSNDSPKSNTLSVTLDRKSSDIVPDDVIGIKDLAQLAKFYGTTTGATLAMGDITGPTGQPDGAVNVWDLSLLCADWNK